MNTNEAIIEFTKALCLSNGPRLIIQQHYPLWKAWCKLCEISAEENDLIERLADALGTAVTGSALVEVARNAHRAEQELASLKRKLEKNLKEMGRPIRLLSLVAGSRRPGSSPLRGSSIKRIQL